MATVAKPTTEFAHQQMSRKTRVAVTHSRVPLCHKADPLQMGRRPRDSRRGQEEH